MKMQKNLGIKGSLLSRARRVMADYGKSTPGERTAVTQRMVNSFRTDGQFRSDVFKPYTTATAANLPKKPKGSLAKTALKTAALAYGGYKLGRSDFLN